MQFLCPYIAAYLSSVAKGYYQNMVLGQLPPILSSLPHPHPRTIAPQLFTSELMCVWVCM